MLEFHKAVKGIAKNEALEVVAADKNGIIGRKSNGKTVSHRCKARERLRRLRRQDIEVSAGDKLLLQANWREKDFRATNGELVTVASVAPDAIKFEDGRTLPGRYQQFTHGYAVTAHRSQGKTVDSEIIAAERMSHDLFYVSATRARESLTVITSDSLDLQESITLSGDRQSATELSKRAATPKPVRDMKHDDLFRTYRAQQERQERTKPGFRPEITQHHVNNRDRTDIGPRF